MKSFRNLYLVDSYLKDPREYIANIIKCWIDVGDRREYVSEWQLRKFPDSDLVQIVLSGNKFNHASFIIDPIDVEAYGNPIVYIYTALDTMLVKLRR